MVFSAFPFSMVSDDLTAHALVDGGYGTWPSGDNYETTATGYGQILGTSDLLVDMSGSDEIIRIAAAANTVSLPDYANSGAAVIVAATPSGVPKIDLASGALADLQGNVYGGETPAFPKIVMKVRYSGKTGDPGINPNCVAVDGTSAPVNATTVFGQEQTDEAGNTWYVYEWSVTSDAGNPSQVSYTSSDVYTDGDGQKHLSPVSVAFKITYTLKNRTYSQYVYMVAKEILCPNGTFMYISDGSQNTRCSYVSQILSKNCESGFAAASGADNCSRAYIDYSMNDATAWDGGAVPGMGSNNAGTGYLKMVSDKTANNAKIIYFEEDGYQQSSTNKYFRKNDEWDNNYVANVWPDEDTKGKSYAYDDNRTLTTLYLDKNADNPDTLDSLNLRMTFKVGESTSFGAFCVAQANVRTGQISENLRSEDMLTTDGASNFVACTNNENGRFLSGYFGDYINGSGSFSAAHGDSDEANESMANLAGSYTLSDNVMYYNTNEDPNTYVMSSGNYLGASDVQGSKYLMMDFTGAPTAGYYTLVYQIIGAKQDNFHMAYETGTSCNETTYTATDRGRWTAFTANSFLVVTNDTTDLSRFVRWIETGDPYPTTSSHAYSFLSTYNGYTQNGINPQQDMFVEGWDAYIAAYQNAKKELCDYAATQTEIDNALAALQSAYAGLKKGKVTIKVNYVIHSSSNIASTDNIIETKVDTFTCQPGDATSELYCGSSIDLRAPQNLTRNGETEANYKLSTAGYTTYKGAITASGGAIGFTPSNGSFDSSKTSGANYTSSPATATVTFTFDYIPNEKIVTFVTNNGYAGNKGVAGEYSIGVDYGSDIFGSVGDGSTIKTMMNAIGGKSHYHYEGIYTDAELTDKLVSFSNGEPVATTAAAGKATEEKTFYIGWAPNDITVKVVRTGVEEGEISSTTVSTTVDENGDIIATITKPATPTPTSTTHDFVNFYKDEDCTTPVVWSAVASYKNDKDLKISDDGVVTVYANFVSNVGQITFDPNGYIVKRDEEIVGASGASFTDAVKTAYGLNADNGYETSFPTGAIDYPVPVKTGYIFTGWATYLDGTLTPVEGWAQADSDSTSTGEYKAVEGGTHTFTKGGVLVATWKPAQYDVIIRLYGDDVNETSRFSTKEKATYTNPDNTTETCYGYFTATVGESYTYEDLLLHTDAPARYKHRFLNRFKNYTTWESIGNSTVVFKSNGQWPAIDAPNGKIYLFADWDTTGTSTLVYTSLDGYKVTAGEAELIDTTGAADHSMSIKGDVVDFRFTVSSRVYASSSSFIFAYDSDFYELPFTDEEYATGNFYAVTVNEENPYIAAMGGTDIEHYENIDSTSLKALEFNTFDQDETGEYVLTKSTYGETVAAANAESELNADGYSMNNFKLIRVSFDPHLDSMKEYKTASLDNQIYMFSLRLKVKSNATGTKGAVRFCNELLRTNETLLGDVYIASTTDSDSIAKALTTQVYETSSGSAIEALSYVNTDVYSMVEIDPTVDPESGRTQTTIKLLLPYGTGYDAGSSETAPYFTYSSYKGNYGYTMTTDGEMEWYESESSTEAKTDAGVLVYYSNGKWIQAKATYVLDGKNGTINGNSFTQITFTGDEGAEILNTYNDGSEGATDFYQTKTTEHGTVSGLQGIPDVKRTYVSSVDGTTKDAYSFLGWYKVDLATGTVDMNDQWTPGYYATEAQAYNATTNNIAYVALWTPEKVTLRWYDDEGCSIFRTECKVDYDSTGFAITDELYRDLSTGSDASAYYKAEYSTDIDFGGWIRKSDKVKVVDNVSENEIPDDFTTYYVSNDADFYADLASTLYLNVSHTESSGSKVDDYQIKISAANQANLVALESGVKMDSEIEAAGKIAIPNAVMHIVPASELESQFANPEINTAATYDFFITYEALDNFLTNDATNGMLTENFSTEFSNLLAEFATGTKKIDRFAVYNNYFDIKEQTTSAVITVDVLQTETAVNAASVEYEAQNATTTFKVKSTAQKYTVVDATKASLLTKGEDDYTYTITGKFGEKYDTAAVTAERDQIYSVVAATGTWDNESYLGYYGIDHELSATVGTITVGIRYLNTDAQAITDIDTSLNQSLKASVTTKIKTLSKTKNYSTQSGWVAADYNSSAPVKAFDGANTVGVIAFNKLFTENDYKNYVKTVTTTTGEGEEAVTETSYELYLMPVFTGNTYNVTFNYNGASQTAPAATTYTYDGTTGSVTVQLANNLTKEGYEFNGYTVKVGTATKATIAATETSYVIGTDIANNANITITANFVLESRTATFSAGDGEFATRTGLYSADGKTYTFKTEYGTEVTFPENPVKTGYTFTGWYDGETEVTEITAISENKTYTAHYEINTYTVTFNAGEGTFATTTGDYSADGKTYTKSAEYNNPITFPENPAKTGYTFNGWYDGDTKVESIANVAADANLTAKYTINKYNVIYKAGEGAFAETTGNYSEDGKTYTFNGDYNSAVTKPATDPTREGYRFEGWQDDVDIVPVDGAEVTAIWVKVYTVEFKVASTGHGSLEGTTTFVKAEGETIDVPTAKADAGYNFSGWDNDLAKTATTYTVGTSNVTFTATFVANEGTVKFLNNDHVTTYHQVSKSTGSTLSPADMEGYEAGPALENYIFIGWTRAEFDPITSERTTYVEYSGITVYYSGEKASDTVKVNLVEVTTENPINITFESNGQVYTFYPVYEEIQVTVNLELATLEGAVTDEVVATEYNYSRENGRVAQMPASGVTGYIYNVGDNQKLTGVENKLAVSGDGELRITPSKSIGGVDLYGTGTKVEVYDNNLGEVVEVYYLIVFGDVDGNGCCNEIDSNLIWHKASDNAYNWDLENAEGQNAILADCYMRAAQIGQSTVGTTISTDTANAIEGYVFNVYDYELVKGDDGERACYYKTV